MEQWKRLAMVWMTVGASLGGCQTETPAPAAAAETAATLAAAPEPPPAGGAPAPKEEAPAVAAPAVEEPPPGDASAGEAVYKKTCLACHAADGRANGGVTGASFVDDATRLAKPDSALVHSIKEGITGKALVMPPQKDLLSDQEILDVIAYIRREFGAK